jgi:hypothetical protein
MVVGLAASAFLFTVPSAKGASAVNSSMTAATDDPRGDYPWQNPGNVFLSNEGGSTWWSHCNNYGNTSVPSQHLTVNGLGFTNIPSGSTINGIQVNVNRRSANRVNAVKDA